MGSVVRPVQPMQKQQTSLKKVKKKNPKPMFAPTAPEVSQTTAMNTGYGSQGGASVKGSGLSAGSVDYGGLLASGTGTLLGR